MIIKKIVAILCICIMVCMSISSGREDNSVNSAFVNEAHQMVLDMGAGINIGNSLDSCDWNTMFTVAEEPEKYETTWGNNEISDQLIGMIADKGFKTVRIPVTYMNHMSDDGNVDQEWLDRVQEVADLVLAHHMYCIIDIHHDTEDSGWIKADQSNYDSNEEKVRNMVTIIAERFKDYDSHLILEGFNEMVDMQGNWSKAPENSYKVMNMWNQLFVDTVRATGAGNKSRYLLVNLYAAAVDGKGIDQFVLPQDTCSDRILVGVHGYTTSDNMKKTFRLMKELSDEGYAVVIGEYGVKLSAQMTQGDRMTYVQNYINYAKKLEVCPIWWDDGGNFKNVSEVNSYAIMDRQNNEWYFDDMADVIAMNGQ